METTSVQFSLIFTHLFETWCPRVTVNSSHITIQLFCRSFTKLFLSPTIFFSPVFCFILFYFTILTMINTSSLTFLIKMFYSENRYVCPLPIRVRAFICYWKLLSIIAKFFIVFSRFFRIFTKGELILKFCNLINLYRSRRDRQEPSIQEWRVYSTGTYRPMQVTKKCETKSRTTSAVSQSLYLRFPITVDWNQYFN